MQFRVFIPNISSQAGQLHMDMLTFLTMQAMYCNITMRRVRVTTVPVENK